MTTSTAPSASPEGWGFDEDKQAAKEEARVRLIRRVVAPVGNSLIDSFPDLGWKPGSLSRILKEYKHQRDEAETAMRGGQIGHCMVIDRHKVGAAFVMSILDESPLERIDGGTPGQEGERLANAILAFKTAVSIVAAFSRLEARRNGDALSLARWSKELTYPLPRDGKSYRLHSFLAMHSAHRRKKLSLPILANWLFVIEQYNNRF